MKAVFDSESKTMDNFELLTECVIGYVNGTMTSKEFYSKAKTAFELQCTSERRQEEFFDAFPPAELDN